MKFVELTYINGGPVIVNLARVYSMSRMTDGTVIRFSETSFTVKEAPSEILAKPTL